MYQDNLKNDSEVVMKSDNKKVALIAIGSTIAVLLGIGGVFLLGKQFGGSNTNSSSVSLASLSVSSKSNSTSSNSSTVSSSSTASSTSSAVSSLSSATSTPTPAPTPVPVTTTVGYTDPALPGFSIGNLDGWKFNKKDNSVPLLPKYTFTKGNSVFDVVFYVSSQPTGNFVDGPIISNNNCVEIGNTWNRCVIVYPDSGRVPNNKRMFYVTPTVLGKQPEATMTNDMYSDIRVKDLSIANFTLTFDTDKTIADTLVSSIQF
jgi:hypothetical protein